MFSETLKHLLLVGKRGFLYVNIKRVVGCMIEKRMWIKTGSDKVNTLRTGIFSFILITNY
jgi:uncharacterized membrane protein